MMGHHAKLMGYSRAFAQSHAQRLGDFCLFSFFRFTFRLLMPGMSAPGTQ